MGRALAAACVLALSGCPTVDLGDTYLQIDTGENVAMAQAMIEQLGANHKPVQCIAYSHGHLGYNFACPVWLADAKALGYSEPAIVAQDQAEVLMRLFQRTGPLMELLLAIQFALGIVEDSLLLSLGTDLLVDRCLLFQRIDRHQHLSSADLIT